MVSVFNVSGQGLNPDCLLDPESRILDRAVWVQILARHTVLCIWTGYFTLTEPLSIQNHVY